MAACCAAELLKRCLYLIDLFLYLSTVNMFTVFYTDFILLFLIDAQ